MISRIRSPFYIFFLNPVYVAARSLRSLRSNNSLQMLYLRGNNSLQMLFLVWNKELNWIELY